MPSANKGDYDRARDAQRSRDAAASKGGLGGYTGLKDMFAASAAKSGGAPATSARPQAKPGVVKTGTGKDARFMDTKTGKSYAAPEYGALSFRGLTSTDPANVARNRYGQERMAAARADMAARGGPDRSGIASLQAPSPQPAPLPVAPTDVAAAPAPAPVDLTQIGMPTTEMAPIFVAPPVYGAPAPQIGPGYGAAFAGAPVAPQFSMMDLIDLFGPTMNFGR